MNLAPRKRRIIGLGAIISGMIGVSFSFVFFGFYGLLSFPLFVILAIEGVLLLRGIRGFSYLLPVTGILATLLSVAYYSQEGLRPLLFVLVLLSVILLGRSVQAFRVDHLAQN